jgi:hypothetical protein
MCYYVLWRNFSRKDNFSCTHGSTHMRVVVRARRVALDEDINGRRSDHGRLTRTDWGERGQINLLSIKVINIPADSIRQHFPQNQNAIQTCPYTHTFPTWICVLVSFILFVMRYLLTYAFWQSAKWRQLFSTPTALKRYT